MTPYPEYKPTGLPWLPEIPREWETIKIRELFTERNQKVSDKDYAPLSVSKGGIVPQIATVAKTDNGAAKLCRNRCSKVFVKIEGVRGEKEQPFFKKIFLLPRCPLNFFNKCVFRI